MLDIIYRDSNSHLPPQKNSNILKRSFRPEKNYTQYNPRYELYIVPTNTQNNHDNLLYPLHFWIQILPKTNYRRYSLSYEICCKIPHQLRYCLVVAHDPVHLYSLECSLYQSFLYQYRFNYTISFLAVKKTHKQNRWLLII